MGRQHLFRVLRITHALKYQMRTLMILSFVSLKNTEHIGLAIPCGIDLIFSKGIF